MSTREHQPAFEIPSSWFSAQMCPDVFGACLNVLLVLGGFGSDLTLHPLPRGCWQYSDQGRLSQSTGKLLKLWVRVSEHAKHWTALVLAKNSRLILTFSRSHGTFPARQGRGREGESSAAPPVAAGEELAAENEMGGMC